MSTIQRFIKAQQGQEMYIPLQQAYEELKAGKKQSHWIWYIFPQLHQLGFSATAQFLGLPISKKRVIIYKMKSSSRIITQWSN